MFKKDPIFWWATGIFILALVLTGIFKDQLFIFLMVGSYLLRPTLASLGLARHLVDERQMSINYRSGNIAFVVMIIVSIILAVTQSIKGNPHWDLFNIVVALGLAGKALSNVILTGNYRDGAVKIIMTVGLLLTLFSLVENLEGQFALVPFFLHALPGLVIIVVGWLARIFPKTVAIILFLITIVSMYFVLKTGSKIGQITAALVLALPLIAAGVGLLLGDREKSAIN